MAEQPVFLRKYISGILLLVAFFWGINVPMMKVGLSYLPPLVYTVLRISLATLTAWVVLIKAGGIRPMPRRDWRDMLAISFFGYLLFQILYAFGISLTTSGNAAIIVSLLPVSVVLINRLWGKETVTWQISLGILATLVGVGIIVFGSGKEISLSSEHLQGAILVLAAQFAFAYYTVFSKGLFARYSQYQVVTYVLTVSTIFFIIAAIPGLLALHWREVPAVAWLSVIFSGLVNMYLCNVLWAKGIEIVGSTRTALYNNLVPVFAVAGGCIFLKEPFGLLQFIGAMIIFAGIYLARSRKTQQ